MVTALAIDVGSSSVKCAVLGGTEPVSPLIRQAFPTRYDGVRAEVDPRAVLSAIAKAARQAVAASVGKPVDIVALSVMSPSWVALDKKGIALTPIVTHQDRRSIAEAKRIESEIGHDEHLSLTGNRPVPGGISSTTAAWFIRHHPALIRRAALVGHLQTLLLNRLTGARAMDPSNASFTGLWNTTAPDTTDPNSGWNEQLLNVIGLRRSQLPAVLPADTVAGTLRPPGARLLGLPTGTPVLTGLVDTSAAIVLAGAEPGMLVNVSGSTDVLAVVTAEPRPNPRYLTRHLGVGHRWVSVATLPSAGSAVVWARETLYSESTEEAFFRLVRKLSRSTARRTTKPSSTSPAGVRFEPALAGSRTEVDQPTGAFTGLRLSTTREEMLSAVLDALAKASAARLPALASVVAPKRLKRDVLRTGGTGKALADILYRDWPGKWAFADVPEATLLGLGALASGIPA